VLDVGGAEHALLAAAAAEGRLEGLADQILATVAFPPRTAPAGPAAPAAAVSGAFAAAAARARVALAALERRAAVEGGAPEGAAGAAALWEEFRAVPTPPPTPARAPGARQARPRVLPPRRLTDDWQVLAKSQKLFFAKSYL
jgi:hypothetical protein